jgi:hypothetical protein
MATLRTLLLLSFLSLLLSSAEGVEKSIVIYLPGGGRTTQAAVDRDTLLLEKATKGFAQVIALPPPQGGIPSWGLRVYSESDIRRAENVLEVLKASNPTATVHFVAVSAAVWPLTTRISQYVADHTQLRVGTVVAVLPFLPYAPGVRPIGSRPPLPSNFDLGVWLEINHPMSPYLQILVGANRTTSLNARPDQIRSVNVAGFARNHVCYLDFLQLLRAHSEETGFWIENEAVPLIQASVIEGPEGAKYLFEADRRDIEYKGWPCWLGEGGGP